MLALVMVAYLQHPTIAALDQLAVARNVSALDHYLVGPKRAVSPFQIVKVPGAYDVGSRGWHVLPLADVDGKHSYAVFSTPLTNEDTGELVFAREGGKLRYVAEEDAMGVHVVHHKLDVKFAPKDKSVAIDDVVTFRSVGTGKSFLFRMGPQYRVSAIVDANGKPVPFHQSGGVVSVPHPVVAEWSWTIRYAATVDLPMYAGSVGEQEATLTNDYFYPMVARWPSTYEATIHGPAKWTAVAQGELVDSQVAGDERVTRYRMDLPVTYFSMSCGPYVAAFQKLEGRSYGMWSARVPAARMRLMAPLYQPILQFYERFAPYPFTQYGGLDSPNYGGGAMEAYSYATYGGGLPSEDPHEPAHTWWGGMINNTYFHSFWNESFAVYSEGLFEREANLGMRSERRSAFYRVARGESAYDTYPIARAGAEVGGVASALGYGKGALVLQMLEQYLGPDRMIEAMREWQARQPKGVPGEWEDFEKVVLSLFPNLDLKGFFDDWLRRPGYARFSADAPTFSRGVMSMTFRWTGPAYRTPCEVMVQEPDGTRYTRVFDLRPTNGVATATWKLSLPPRIVSIDPYRRMLRDTHDDETPIRLEEALRWPGFHDAAHREYTPELRAGGSDIPADWSGKLIVGHPDSVPAMKPLLDKLGWTVLKNRLTFDDTSIDLNNGAAYAVVELGEGKRCAIALGKTALPPRLGNARVAIVDVYGRILRAATDPKTTGFMTFRMN